MVTIKYDVGDVEEFTPYAGPTPQRGIYDCRISQAEFGPSKNKNDQFTFTCIIDTKKKDQTKFNGAPLFQNCTIGDLSEDWQKRNLKMVVKAFGMKEAGNLNTDALVKKALTSRVRVIVKTESSEEYGVQAKANGLLPFKAEEEPEDGADEATDAEVDDTEVADDEVADDEVDDTSTSDEEGDEDDGLDELDRAGLKAYIKEHSLDLTVKRSWSDDDLRAAIRELIGTEDEGTVEDDIKDLDRTALKAYIKENELAVTVKRSWSDDDLRAAIIAAWPDDEDGAEAADDSEPPF